MHDLILGQDAIEPEAGHVGACGKGLRVVDLPVDVALHRLGSPAQRAEAIETRPDSAEGDLRGSDAVAVVAAAAIGALRVRIGEAQSVAVLSDSLALAPVAEQLSGSRIADLRRLRTLDVLGDVLGRFVAVARAQSLRLVLLLDARGHLPVAVREGLAEDPLGARARFLFRETARASGEDQGGDREGCPHRLSPGAWISPPLANLAMYTVSAIDASEA